MDLEECSKGFRIIKMEDSKSLEDSEFKGVYQEAGFQALSLLEPYRV